MKSLEPIAIIGTGCRFPGGASSPAKLWELLRNPKDLARKIPAERFNIDAFYHQDGDFHGRTNVQESYFLDEDIRAFDAAFFNISPAEAASMDPQQRVLLETVYESVDAAGLRMDALQGSMTGVFCGTLRNDYTQLQAMDPQAFPAYMVTGNSPSIMANRVSYYFDWRGPSMAVDTGCSSSLLAVHLAVEALHHDDCSMAVAVGSNLILSPTAYIADSKTHMLSPTGRSRMWDKNADGYARGEGVASVVLKRLRDAIHDGDPIECVIRATGANSDGRTMGITMPSADAQQALIRATYARAGLSPQERPQDRCQYFEAHGTGTQAGDPQEATAIHGSFFGPDCAADDMVPLHVGSMKTVIGHTEATAGLAGLIKASLSLQHGLIVPNLLMQELNPKIVPFSGQLSVPTKCLPWPELPDDCPRRASVNSFGFGGANVHVILESYVPPSAVAAQNLDIALPFVFSAASERTLTAVLESYARFIQGDAEINLFDLASSLWARRSAHSHRFTLVAHSIAELQDLIAAELHRRTVISPSSLVFRPSSRPKQILGIFTGQGVQWPRMGFDLIESSPEVRSWMDELQTALDQLPLDYAPKFSLLEQLSRPACSSRVHDGLMSLPLRTAVQIIQVNLLRRVGINISVAVGHSSGEIVAGYAAGVLTAPDAIRIAYLRGKAISEARDSTGCMMAVNLTWDQAQAICAIEPYCGRITVAAANSPFSVTLSGNAESLRELEWLLKSLGLTPRRLRVDTAYHSPYMKPCADPYRQAMSSYPASAMEATTPWFSSVYPGIKMGGGGEHDLASEYWVENMLQPVQFSQALEVAFREMGPPDLIVEIGPHPTLKGPVLQTLSHVFPAQSTVPYLALAQREKSGFDSWAAALGTAWMHLGPAKVNLADYISLFALDHHPTLVESLPLYPFDNSQIYWAQSRLSKSYALCTTPFNTLLGALSSETGLKESRWRNYFKLQELPWLAERRIGSEAIFPEMGYISIALEVGMLIAKTARLHLLELTDLTIHAPLPIVDDPIGTEVLTMVTGIASRDGVIDARFNCQCIVAGEIIECATATMTLHSGGTGECPLPPRGALNPALGPVKPSEFYDSLRRRDYRCKGLFAGLTSLFRRGDIALGTVSSSPKDPNGPIHLHPAILETAVQTLIAALGDCDDHLTPGPFLPQSIHSVWVDPALCLSDVEGKEIQLVGYVTQVDENGVQGDIDIFTSDGDRIAQLESVQLVRAVSESANDTTGLYSTTEWGPLEPTLKLFTGPIPPNLALPSSLGEILPVLHLKASGPVIVAAQNQPPDSLLVNVMGWMNHSAATVFEGSKFMSSLDWLDMNGQCFTASIRKSGQEHVPLGDIDAVSNRFQDIVHGSVEREGRWSPMNQGNDCLMYDPLLSHLRGSLVTIASQVCFRFPHLDILQIGTLGIPTHCTLKNLGRSYHSFTYGTPSTVAGGISHKNGEDASLNVQHRPIDLERDPGEQGVLDHSYGMLLYTAVEFPQKSIVAHLQRLLKPEGYLLVLVRVSMRPPFDSQAPLPCAGVDHLECHCNGIVNLAEWCDLLSNSGFTRIECLEVGQDMNDIPQGFALLLCKRSETHERIAPRCGELIMLHADGMEQKSPFSELPSLIDGEFERIIQLQALKALDVPSCTDLTALMLMDNRHLSTIDVATLQRLVRVAKRILCVTWEREEQYAAALLRGLLRSHVAAEDSPCTIQVLTVTNDAILSADILAAALQRFIRQTDIQKSSDSSELSLVEPEIRFDGSLFCIPRQYPDRLRNRDDLASRQMVTELVDPSQTGIKAVPWTTDKSNSRFRIVSIGQRGVAADRERTVQIRVRHSSLSAVRVADGVFLYLAIGQEIDSSERMIALSPCNASQLAISRSWVWPVLSAVPESDEPSLLHAIAAALTGEYLVEQVSTSETLLVHEADRALQSILAVLAVQYDVRVVFSTSEKTSDSDSSTLFLHERSTTRQLAGLMPRDISAIAALNRHQNQVVDRMISLVPTRTKRTCLGDVHHASASAVPVDREEIQQVTKAFMAAYLLAQNYWETMSPSSVISISITGLSEETTLELEQKAIDWTCTAPVRAEISSKSSMLQLSYSKTYLVLGVTGDMTEIVCHSLVKRGAKWILVGNSEAPWSNSLWSEKLSRQGAQIAHLTMNLADPSALYHLDRTIPGSFPRTIGGVLFKPEPLPDCAFSQLISKALQDHLFPRVKALQVLDSLHGEPDLEFWVLIGSIPGTLGHPHQAMTVAMTDAMGALVRRRRSQGRPASLIHIGDIENTDELSKEQQGWWGSTIVTRRDVEGILAEAILHGQGDATRNPEFIAGLRHQRARSQHFRSPLPRMLPFVSLSPSAEDNVSSVAHETLSIRERVAAATNAEDKAQAIQAGLVDKIRAKLNLSHDAPLTSHTLLPELGVDSLVAVELRRWFSKEVGVDIPVISLLSGASIGELAVLTAAKLCSKDST